MTSSKTWYHGVTTFKFMHKHALNDEANCQTYPRTNCTKCLLLVWMTIHSKRKNWKLWDNDLKCAGKSCFNACILLGLADGTSYETVYHLARSVTNWNRACDNPSARLISYAHHTGNYSHHCHVGSENKFQLFQFDAFAGDLTDSESTSGGVLCTVASHTIVPISWSCKKRTAVSHSSAEAEIISLDVGVRIEGIPVLSLWKSHERVVTVTSGRPAAMSKRVQSKKNKLDTIVHLAISILRHRADTFHACEHHLMFSKNAAVIKMIVKSWSPNMRHVSRTHRVDLDWSLIASTLRKPFTSNV